MSNETTYDYNQSAETFSETIPQIVARTTSGTGFNSNGSSGQTPVAVRPVLSLLIDGK